MCSKRRALSSTRASCLSCVIVPPEQNIGVRVFWTAVIIRPQPECSTPSVWYYTCFSPDCMCFFLTFPICINQPQTDCANRRFCPCFALHVLFARFLRPSHKYPLSPQIYRFFCQILPAAPAFPLDKPMPYTVYLSCHVIYVFCIHANISSDHPVFSPGKGHTDSRVNCRGAAECRHY